MQGKCQNWRLAEAWEGSSRGCSSCCWHRCWAGSAWSWDWFGCCRPAWKCPSWSARRDCWNSTEMNKYCKIKWILRVKIVAHLAVASNGPADVKSPFSVDDAVVGDDVVVGLVGWIFGFAPGKQCRPQMGKPFALWWWAAADSRTMRAELADTLAAKHLEIRRVLVGRLCGRPVGGDSHLGKSLKKFVKIQFWSFTSMKASIVFCTSSRNGLSSGLLCQHLLNIKNQLNYKDVPLNHVHQWFGQILNPWWPQPIFGHFPEQSDGIRLVQVGERLLACDHLPEGNPKGENVAFLVISLIIFFEKYF